MRRPLFPPMRPLDPKRLHEWLVTTPSLGWLVMFFLVPSVLVLLLGFRPHDIATGTGEGWTLGNWARIGESALLPILWRTLWVSTLATAICLVIAVPAALGILHSPLRLRPWLLLAVVIPFWTNFVLRVFAWRTLLHPDGWFTTLVSGAARLLHLVEPGGNVSLLYNLGAVCMVSVYTFLPFTILPIYAAAGRFDFQLIDAARDLGATRFDAFMRVFLPGISAGLVSAFFITFVPMLGSYVIPDLVGGPDGLLLGQRIQQRSVGSGRNLPEAAILSTLLMAAVAVPVLLGFRRGREGKASQRPTDAGTKPG